MGMTGAGTAAGAGISAGAEGDHDRRRRHDLHGGGPPAVDAGPRHEPGDAPQQRPDDQQRRRNGGADDGRVGRAAAFDPRADAAACAGGAFGDEGGDRNQQQAAGEVTGPRSAPPQQEQGERHPGREERPGGVAEGVGQRRRGEPADRGPGEQQDGGGEVGGQARLMTALGGSGCRTSSIEEGGNHGTHGRHGMKTIRWQGGDRPGVFAPFRVFRVFRGRTLPPLHVALYEPEMPANTGNIGRLCVGAGCPLHLVGSSAGPVSTTGRSSTCAARHAHRTGGGRRADLRPEHQGHAPLHGGELPRRRRAAVRQRVARPAGRGAGAARDADDPDARPGAPASTSPTPSRSCSTRRCGRFTGGERANADAGDGGRAGVDWGDEGLWITSCVACCRRPACRSGR